MKATEIVVKPLGETRGRHLDVKTAHAFKRKCVPAGRKLVEFEQKVTLRIGDRALDQLLPRMKAHFREWQRFGIHGGSAVDDSVLPQSIANESGAYIGDLKDWKSVALRACCQARRHNQRRQHSYCEPCIHDFHR